MTHRIVETADAPAAIGAYSQAINTGNTLYTSGQIALNPEDGTFVGVDDVARQAEQAIANLFAVIRAAGFAHTDIVKATIFLVDMSHFSEVNRIYGEAMGDHRPARSTVAVSALPRGALVEIDAICCKA